ncbi:MAG: S8 family serine peptidase [Desulfobacteraceae bacterium]|jgi:serine protease|nr:S8 family serine peptidase [Desulfobacteraceae bacterium]
MYKYFISILLVAGVLLCLQAQARAESRMEGDWFLEGIHAPRSILPISPKRTIVIAIVDDGVRVSHQDLHEFIWSNPNEIPANGIDDDGNGYADDIHGWDVADANNTVTPPDNRLEEFYHGTHLAGVMTRIARRAYGDSAAERIQIMPVKSLADSAGRTYLKDGYKGIEYAIQAGADIILCAWSVGQISAEESRTLRNAERKGILIVGSAGNFSQRTEQYPAAFETVLAVAAINQQAQKTEISDYGLFVDLSAPGIDVLGASARSDTDYETREGTSQAAAIVAASAAIVKLQHPSYSWREVTVCLKQSAEPIDAVNQRYTASLGAGKLNLKAAIECNVFNDEPTQSVALVNPQGYLHFDRRRGETAAWTITPQGESKGIRFRPQFDNKQTSGGTINFYAGASADALLVASHSLTELPESIYVAGTTAYVTIETKGKIKPLTLLMDYKAEPIDFRCLYCTGTKNLDVEGAFDDGSGPNDYSYDSDCKWLITAPKGKFIQIKFSEFDTQAKIDKVYFFDGGGTHEDIMAIFSGPNIPPELTTWHNQVLVWFVTDSEEQGKGWRAEYRFVNP